MRVLVLNYDQEDGTRTARQCDQSEITRDDLDGINYARTEIIRFNEATQAFEQASIEVRDSEYIISQWNPL